MAALEAELWPSGTSPERKKEKFYTMDLFQLGMSRMSQGWDAFLRH